MQQELSYKDGEKKIVITDNDMPFRFAKIPTNALLVTKEIPIEIDNSIENDNDLPILLIADDNSEIRSVLKDIFKYQFHILEAEDGENALKIAKKEIPDCIISDIMMPKMNGLEFTKAIKSNELTSFIPAAGGWKITGASAKQLRICCR